MSQRIEGKIAAILSRTTIVINRGTKDGVSAGDKFYIYSRIGPFHDPDTRVDLGDTTKVWGTVEVTIAEERFCVATTGYGSGFLAVLGLEGIFGSTRLELPVDSADISDVPERIRVGFSVLCQKEETAQVRAKAVPLPLPPEPSAEENQATENPPSGPETRSQSVGSTG